MISEASLNAVLHLFAVQAADLRGAAREAARRRVQAYLRHHAGLARAETHAGLFDELAELHEGEEEADRISAAEEMAGRLKALLRESERHAAALHFLELAVLAPERTACGRIARRLGVELGLAAESVEAILAFLSDPAGPPRAGAETRQFGGGGGAFRARAAALRTRAEGLLLATSAGEEALRVEGRPLGRGEGHPLRPGQALRDAWGNELAHAEVVAAFGGAAREAPTVSFCGRRLEFRFGGSENGLHDFSFAERGGRLVAIMGGSGAGKSTLLSILNGTQRPDSGELLLNGRDVHAEPKAVEGWIGHVPQDDLLFEDLTVFENLDYAARLCLAHLPEAERRERVRGLLGDLGQAETADLKVGSPLRKTISGGQRKRLNVALELIREPAVLFVDEPTSGLSSADSDLVMRLLKDQAARGKLVFAAIHQPSSKIFRSFDALWVLDRGGWPIYCGPPLESLPYFRSRAGLPEDDDAICPGCGGVNPEQILEIVEEPLLDAEGLPTRERRVPPREWNRLFRERPWPRRSLEAEAETPVAAEPEGGLSRPGFWGQWRTFFSRDARARLANRAYMAVALLEPLLLGLLVGLVSRGAFGGSYSFHENDNLHVFFFMSVMVALFLGLSSSAEEICRDARILRRERFLHLSWWAYVDAKAFYAALAAALQSALYLAVALPLVELPGMFAKTWATLFACAFSASLLGLNVSATFRSAATIYVLVPLLLIPQMLLCGVVVPYDDLIAPNSARREVPAYANALPPRWAYEALVVEQFLGNAHARTMVEADARVRLAEHELDFHLPELAARLQALSLPEAEAGRRAAQLELLRAEFARLERRTGLAAGLSRDGFAEDDAERASAFLAECRRAAFERRRAAAAERRAAEEEWVRKLGPDGAEAFRRRHVNRAIQNQALNLRDMRPLGEAADGLYHRTLPVYREPESRWGGAHFLAGRKRLGERLVSTWSFNLGAAFALAGLLHVALGLRLLPGLAALGERARARAARGGRAKGGEA